MQVYVMPVLRTNICRCLNEDKLLELLFAAYEDTMLSLTIKFWPWLLQTLRGADAMLLEPGGIQINTR
jgi:hypothetical protein